MNVDLNRLMWLAAGAGSKGLVAGMISGAAPQAGITPDVAAAGIGLILSNQGGERISTFGEGMMISAIGQMVRQPIESIFGRITQPGAQTPEQQAAAVAAAAAAKKQGQGNTYANMDQYAASKYGV